MATGAGRAKRLTDGDPKQDALSRPIADALRSAIAASGLSIYAVAREAGIYSETVTGFFDRGGDLYLTTADKLFGVLGLKMARKSKVALNDPPGLPSDALRSAIAESGLGVRALAKEVGVQGRTIARFLDDDKGGLRLKTADKLFVVLGLKATRESRARRVAPKPTTADLSRPIADALRSAIVASGLSIQTLARQAGVNHMAIRRLVDRSGDMRLALAERIFGVLPLRVARKAEARSEESSSPTGQESRSIADALRSEIAERGLGVYVLARKIGLTAETTRRIMRLRRGVMLSSAETIFGFLGLVVISEPWARRPEPKPLADDPSQPLKDGVRAALVASGLSLYELDKRSGISSATICQFLNGKRNVNYLTLTKLANGVGLNLEPARLQVQPAGTTAAEPAEEGPTPWPTGNCPVSWAPDGSPVAGGHRKRVTTAQLRVIRALHDAGPRGLSGAELRVNSGRGGYRLILKTLAKDEHWASIIREAGGPRGRYRLAMPGFH